MIVIWQVEDLKSGVVMGKPGRAERWMIGYIPKRHRRCLVSLSDGMVIEFENDLLALAHINSSRDIPLVMLEPTTSTPGPGCGDGGQD